MVPPRLQVDLTVHICGVPGCRNTLNHIDLLLRGLIDIGLLCKLGENLGIYWHLKMERINAGPLAGDIVIIVHIGDWIAAA